MPDNPFRKKMEEKNKTQLLYIINNESQFRAEAVEAARAVLQEREHQTNPSSSQQEDTESSKKESDNEEKINPRFSLRAIATYQIVGSLLIMPSIFNLYPQVISNVKNTIILIFFTLLYLTGLVSAGLIFKKRYEGLLASLIFNICQSLYIQMGGFAFFSTGFFYLIVTMPLGFNFNFGSPAFLLSFSQNGGFIIGFNIVATAAVSFLMSALIAFDQNGKFPEHLY